ncbi:pentapeptide repeat-containing protein [Streptomyces sp. NBC_01578]|uniref:pentapeptide repeat-containing protein n=2 Tax=Streptomyces sp. NBC_01578 TaxID=2975884 RepID=UPI00386B4991
MSVWFKKALVALFVPEVTRRWRMPSMRAALEFSEKTAVHCTFRRADLRQATLDGCRFKLCDLRGANLSGASLRGVCLAGCDLTGSGLWGRS